MGASFSAPVQTGPGTHPAYCTIGTGSFPGGKAAGRNADPSPPSNSLVKKEYSYTSAPPMGRTACTEPQCLYSTAIPLLLLWAVRPVQSLSACTVQLYLYSPYGPYGLYRVSVPVQGCTLPFFLHIMKLLIMYFSPLPFHLVPLRPKYSPHYHILIIIILFIIIIIITNCNWVVTRWQWLFYM